MSMVGFGMLIGPAIGGVLSEPVTQHPDVDFGAFESVLLKFPFLLPNLIGALLSGLATLQIIFSVQETLPEDKLRSPKHFVPDAMRWLGGLPSKAWKSLASGRNSDTSNGEYDAVDTTDDEDS